MRGLELRVLRGWKRQQQASDFDSVKRRIVKISRPAGSSAVFLLPCSFYIEKLNPARAGGNAAGDGAVRRALARSTTLGVRRAPGLGQEGLRRGPAHQSKVVGWGLIGFIGSDYRIVTQKDRGLWAEFDAKWPHFGRKMTAVDAK